MLSFLFKKYLFIHLDFYLKGESEEEEEEARESECKHIQDLPTADSSSDGHNGQSWANLKPGASSRLFHMDAGDPRLQPS